MATTNETVLREAAEAALRAFRRMYEILEAGADADDLLDDETLWPLTRLRDALEATPSGGRVVISTMRRGSALYVSVRDTGTGIPAEVMSRIFEPFVTHGKKGGTGLGLSICRRFAEQHGGEVGCRSRLGRGTRFVIRLPA